MPDHRHADQTTLYPVLHAVLVAPTKGRF